MQHFMLTVSYVRLCIDYNIGSYKYNYLFRARPSIEGFWLKMYQISLNYIRNVSGKGNKTKI